MGSALLAAICAPWLAAIARAVAEDGDVREGSQRYRQSLFSVSRAPVRSCGMLALLVSCVTLARICGTGAIIGAAHSWQHLCDFQGRIDAPACCGFKLRANEPVPAELGATEQY